ncbi:hypothetical protein OS493_001387 [Desmophyllum pertusum]|uniref:2-C-methyl-D-erythritol 4-phosphate cytidylyltransferase, chloroplastic n=1 Tax=Desmophyllum pertusum TaxID=174260 RepID=A0A9X0D1C5_9CNID|nr:hypothetical protein OS493_001387 [Desmophyllum pertusum]
MATVDDERELCFDVVAVLPAGGSGVRMNLQLPKQFCHIMDRPLLSYTLEAFENVPWIKEIVVPMNEKYLEVAQQILNEFCHSKVRFISGGSTRHRSIWKGIEALTADGRSPPTVVILHDAVRPFVDEQTLRHVTIAAKKHGAAGVIRPLSSTVVARSCDGFLDHSLDRSKFRSSEMPQAFKYEVIHKAYKQCTEYDFEHGTECLHLAQMYAEKSAALIDGPDSLWKVTYRKDLYSVEGVLREKQVHTVVVIGTGFPKFIEKLREQFHKREVVVAYLPHIQPEQDLSPTMAEQLASEINSKLMASTDCVSVVYVAQSTQSDEKASSETCSTANIKQFLREICQRFNSCMVKRVRVVNVSFSNSRKDFNTLKMATEDLKSCIHQEGISCFGVFVSPIFNNRPEDNDAVSRQIEKATELTIGAMMDVPSVFSGQTFDTNT